MEPDPSPRPWPRLASEPAGDLVLFRPRWDVRENPRTGVAQRCLVLETRDWVNVVARTGAGLYVLVRQFRFGSERVTTEIPGGVVDPGEEPAAAARRELLEETGYVSEAWTELGSVEPNPAFHDNRCHHYMADGATLAAEPSLDPGEDIAVVTLTEDEVRRGVERGEIAHSLVLSALGRVLDLRARATRSERS